jgi:hypothetical protein
LAKRPHVFPVDTILYHPVEGALLFPAGETDPGDLWKDSAGGDPEGDMTRDAAIRELSAANERIAQLGRKVEAMGLDLQTMSEERDAANARAQAAETHARDLQQALDAFAGAPDKRTVETPDQVAGVVIPENWEKLPFLSLKSLASKVSPTPVTNKEEVHAAIRRHLGLI